MPPLGALPRFAAAIAIIALAMTAPSLIFMVCVPFLRARVTYDLA
jgi:hypothetical protein